MSIFTEPPHPVRVRSGGCNTPPRTDGHASPDNSDKTGHKPDGNSDKGALLNVSDLLRELAAQGVTLAPQRDMISVTGSPSPLLADEILRHKQALLDHLRRQRALQLAAVLDGPGQYEQRMKQWPEYEDLCNRIADHDGGNP